MAPQAYTMSAGAARQTSDDEFESQDSQLLVAALHRLHGIGIMSSTPIEPLEYEEALYQQIQQLREARQAGTVPPTTPKPSATTSESAKSIMKPPSRSTKDSIRGGRPRNTLAGPENPTVTNGKGPGPGPSAANFTSNLVQTQQAQTTVASITRVPTSDLRLSSTPLLASNFSTFSTDFNGAGVQRRSQSDAAIIAVNPSATLPAAAIPVLDTTSSSQRDDSRDDQVNSRCKQIRERSLNPSVSRIQARRGLRRKMESSQSPTQSNEGRSYDQYDQYIPRGDDLVSSDPLRPGRFSQPSRQSSPSLPREHTENHDDEESGEVNFDFSALGGRDTQLSIPESLGTGMLHFTDPETPAVPRNPFSGGKSGLMASSQMFKHTQFSSAYKPPVSPTSSRPSPDNLRPLNAISPNPSPLKRMDVAEPSSLQNSPSFSHRFPRARQTSPNLDTDEQVEDDCDLTTSGITKSFRLPPRKVHAGVDEAPDMSEESSLPNTDPDSNVDSQEELSEDEATRRYRQRAMLKKAAAARRLNHVSLDRELHSEDEIVPSTSKENLVSSAPRHLDRFDGFPIRDSQNAIADTQEAVEDSQDDTVLRSTECLQGHTRSQVVGNASSNDAVVPDTDPGPTIPASVNVNNPTASPMENAEGGAEDQIPETSPAMPKVRALGDMMPGSSEFSGSGSFVKLLESSPFVVHETPRSTRASKPTDHMENQVNHSVEVDILQPAPAFSTRARLRERQKLHNSSTSSPAQPSSSGSSLSRLTSTPLLSDRTSPDITTGEARSSPAVAKSRRQNNNKTHAGKKGSRPSATRTGKSAASVDSASTDELAKSPRSLAPAVGPSTRVSRSGRVSLQEPSASRETSRGAKTFAGMAFAVSFRSRQKNESHNQYKARSALPEEICTTIKSNGGKVLADGFNELFEATPVKSADRGTPSSTPQPDDEIKLLPAAAGTGFTALIADGHSRKAKYMQALALGLPCLHYTWITACIEKQRLMDWSPYLLCAGNSAFLDDAIKSRMLMPYDAGSAKLSDILVDRPRLLDQSRILLIMARSEEGQKAAYIFLARVLGASLSRVYTIDEARKQLKAREDAGDPFDWVYVDEGMDDTAALFTGPGSAGATAGNKKRKRRSEVSVSDAPPPKKIRTLSNELVVQSLILGRLLEEGEIPV